MTCAGLKMRCSICKQKGHNKLTCRTALNIHFWTKTAEEEAEVEHRRLVSQVEQAKIAHDSRKQQNVQADGQNRRDGSLSKNNLNMVSEENEVSYIVMQEMTCVGPLSSVIELPTRISNEHDESNRCDIASHVNIESDHDRGCSVN